MTAEKICPEKKLHVEDYLFILFTFSLRLVGRKSGPPTPRSDCKTHKKNHYRSTCKFNNLLMGFSCIYMLVEALCYLHMLLTECFSLLDNIVNAKIVESFGPKKKSER